MMRKSKKIFKRKNSYYQKNYRQDEVIEKRYNLVIGAIVFLNVVLFLSLFQEQVVNHEAHNINASRLSRTFTYGTDAPRGRIYDRNYNLIVDNKANRIIYYSKPRGISQKEEVKLAYKASEIIDLDYDRVTERQLKRFYFITNRDQINERITDMEWQQLRERRITLSDIEKLRYERITGDDLNSMNERDKKAAHMYHLMNVGYSFSDKVIKDNDISEQEYAIISEKIDHLNGFDTRLEWDRYYPHGATFRSILGRVSSSRAGVPLELKDHYLDRGYNLTNRVGVSGIEFQYEEHLRGISNKYQIMSDRSLKLYEPGVRGDDLVLTIDIKLQNEIEKILEENLVLAKSEPNTELYNRTFVIVNDPNTGELLAMAGKQIIVDEETDEYKIYDFTPGIYTSPVVAGSVVKAASQIVAYEHGGAEIGEIRDDSCIKIASTPIKCSIRYMGRINDIDALAKSSNTYQYRSAIKIGNGNYVYNRPLSLDEKAFDIYRNTFKEFGLGAKTEIEIPAESIGYFGPSKNSGFLLDFSIGQYDTYTPIQIAQYMSTVANGGSRLQPLLLKSVYDGENNLQTQKYSFEPNKLNKVNASEEHFERVHEGLRAVMLPGGTGYYAIDPSLNAAGKTGTSESFIDTTGDGIIDTSTITHTFSSYMPYDEPRYVLTVISPDVSHENRQTRFVTPVNRRVINEVSKKIFEIME